MFAGLRAAATPSWADVRDVGRVLEERIGGKTRWRLDFGWKDYRRIRINAQSSDVFRPFVRRLADDGVIAKVPKSPRSRCPRSRSR
jgi:hypothetical protein